MSAVMKERPRKRIKVNLPDPLAPYVDRGRAGGMRYGVNGNLLAVKEPAPVERVILTLQALRRHNTLEPALQPTDRTLLRWGESGGTGLWDPDADRRETHYDPLPPDLQKKVDRIVDGCAWETFAYKWYRTSMTATELAEWMRISRTQLYKDWRAALWYFTGRFEAERIHS